MNTVPLCQYESKFFTSSSASARKTPKASKLLSRRYIRYTRNQQFPMFSAKKTNAWVLIHAFVE